MHLKLSVATALVAGLVTAGGVIPAAAPALASARAASAAGGGAANTPFCQHLGKLYQASAAAQMICHGIQPTGPAARRSAAAGGPAASPSVSQNVNAASLAEDVSPSGARAYGQSETSVAAAGQYVVESWNDSTGFFSPCPSAGSKEELTGFSFSANGGKSFTDLGGLPNGNCANKLYEGDPSVTAYQVAGRTHFYITSLYNSPDGLGLSYLAMAACTAAGSGSSAKLACGQPRRVAVSTTCVSIKGLGKVCDFLDKDYAAIDPARGRLYVSFTNFPVTGSSVSNVELAVCDLGTSSGGTGAAGGTPSVPVCENGQAKAASAPYFTVARGNSSGCELEGAYPAVDPATGAVYVGFESNWFTNLFGGPCGTEPTTEVMTKVPLSCLPLAATSPCTGPAVRTSVRITSMDGAFIPGYDRFPGNDFPRLAVSGPAGTVSMVWNDARTHALGDILLQSFGLSSLARVQKAPVALDTQQGGVNFLPALRTATAGGRLDVTWYARKSPTTADTSVLGALGISPRQTATPSSNIRITDVMSNWDNVSSDITPNFGDYTDNSLVATGKAPYVGSTLFVAWSDGRLGLPQPFEAHVPG